MLLPFFTENLLECGCDEAGRGCLAGPVFAAAVILPKKFNNNLLNDSKKLSEKNRYLLREIIEIEAIEFSVYQIDQEKIDAINILNSSILAMHFCIENLKNIPELLLIDGNKFYSYKNIPHKCIIRGDGKYFSIAAASILAKTYRDDFMKKIDLEFPQYDWKNNKGYGSKKHLSAIEKFGITKYHRKSFNPIKKNLFSTIRSKFLTLC